MAAQKGSQYCHLVKWDDDKAGGRWFECTIVRMEPDLSEVLVTPFDNRHHTVAFSKDRVVIITNEAVDGDDVIAYWDDRKYAFAGRVNGERDSEFYVEFADGGKGWIPKTKVYKRKYISIVESSMAGQKGSQYCHLVRWDDDKAGGRWFECTIARMEPDLSEVLVTPFDNRHHTVAFSKDRVVKITNEAVDGDDVIAYWDDREYAFAGRVNGERDSEFYVEFADGDKGWIPKAKVYKRKCVS